MRTLMQRRADSLFDYAVSVSGCERPLIALNEMWGASLPTPLTPTAERYRANVLRFVTRLSERGGRPALLVSSEPFTGGDAGAWWRAIGQVSDIVLEKYANANLIWREGAVDGSRRLRTGYRASAAKLFAIGIPPSRVGLMIGFQTGAGSGGREGLQPRSRWFDVAKWQAFAAEQVSRELRLTHVWSWGWAQRNERSNDPDKTFAACVWLWARDPGLCDAPEILGQELDADRRAGQIDLPAGVRCVYDGNPLTASGVAALAKVTGDRELALTALVVRAVERQRANVSTSQILAAERRIIAARFGGSAASYRAALAERGASLAVARAIVGDELRRAEIHEGLATPRSSTADVARFRATFAGASTRRLVVSPAPSWLPDGSGLALATSAPRGVFEIATPSHCPAADCRRCLHRTRARGRLTRSAQCRSRSHGPPSSASSRANGAPRPTSRGRSASRRMRRAGSYASGTGCRSTEWCRCRASRRSFLCTRPGPKTARSADR